MNILVRLVGLGLAWGLAFAVVQAQAHADEAESAGGCHARAVSPSRGSEVARDVTQSDLVLPSGAHRKTVQFHGIPLRGHYRSMKGPFRSLKLKLLSTQESPTLWITRYHAEVLNKNGSAAQEFMCHTSLDLMKAGPDGAAVLDHQQMAIAQGQKDIELPPGFALRVPNGADQNLDLLVMVLNNNYPKLKTKLDFKTTITYFSEAEASRRALKPLNEMAVTILCPLDAATAGSQDQCETATRQEIQSDGGRRVTGHWWVQPGGRYEWRSDVTAQLNLKADQTIHYIWMHVHPYAKSLELVDLTTAKTVWKGEVIAGRDRAIIRKTASYQSREGLPLYKNHRYQLISIYDNPTGERIDAMASLWMYAEDTPAATFKTSAN